MALKDRIQELIEAGHSRSDLARFAGVSAAAVSHWVSGETRVLKSEVAALLQQKTGYSAVWISTGKLPKKIDQATSASTVLGPEDQTSSYWPFAVTPHEFQSSMTAEDIARLNTYIQIAVIAKQAKTD